MTNFPPVADEPPRWRGGGLGVRFGSAAAGLESFASVEALVPPAPPPRKPHGVYVTARCGFALILLIVLIAAVVGLLFNFVVTRKSLETPAAWTVGKSASHSALTGGGGVVDAQGACLCNTSTAAPGALDRQHPDADEVDAPTPPPDFRLPKDLVPYHYAADLKANIYEPNPGLFTLNGTVKIRFTCVTATSSITLHKSQLTSLTDYSLRHADGSAGAPKILDYSFNKFNSFLTFNLAGALTVSRNYTLAISFHSPLQNDDTGLFYRSYNTEDGRQRYMVASQMQPTDARKVFPCFDEPAMKAIFTLSLWRKPHMITMSNMPVRDTVVSPGGWLLDRYYDTPRMSTYILAVAICDYAYVTTAAGLRNSIVRVWAPENMVGNTRYALNVAANITNYFEKLLEEEFPLPKQDMIYVPQLPALAMENWGLITYNKEALFFHPVSSLAREKVMVAKIVAHEIAHQWFGNLVTPSWWSELWLSEGLSTYMQYLGMTYVDKSWEMEMQILPMSVFPAKRADSQPNSHAIRLHVQTYQEIYQMFDSITYEKGASIVRQAHFALGDQVFFGGLKKYLKKWKYRSADEETLFEAWQEEATSIGLILNVSDFMQTWTNQMGFPVITLTYKDKSTHQAKQELFWDYQNSSTFDIPESPSSYKWYVPLTVISDKRPFFNVSNRDITWMSRKDDTKDLAVDFNKWFIINGGAYGFYRVNYENVVWDALAEQLQIDHEVIHESNRAQLIDDAFNLARYRYIDIEKALAITKYIKRETKYVPLDVGLKELGHIGDLLLTRPSYGSFAAYMKSLLAEPYRRLARLSRAQATDFSHPSADIMQRISKIIIFNSCLYDVEDCRTTAKTLFDEWVTNGTAIPLHARAAAYCYGVRSGGAAGWEHVFARYSTVRDDDSERAHLLDALSCTTEPWLLNRLLTYSLDETKIARDLAPNVIKQIASTAIGKYIVWSFIRANWIIFHAEHHRFDQFLPAVLLEIMRTFSTEQDLKDVTDLAYMQDRRVDLSRPHELVAVETEIRKNINFLNANEPKIIRWLQT